MAVIMGLFAGSRGLFSLLIAGAVAFCTSGCAEEYVLIQAGTFPRPMIFADALAWTRHASSVVNTFHDYEQAKEAAYGSFGQLEGLHMLVPESDDGLILLVKAWSGVAYAFMDDDREEALDHKDEQLAAYHEARARAAFKRARFYGDEYMERQAEGFKAAQRNADTLRAYLRSNFTDKKDAEILMWLAFSIVGRVAFDLDNPETVAELWIGIELLDHTVKLDPEIENGTAYTMLGAAHAGLKEWAEAKTDFDNALRIGQGRLVTAQLTMAVRYYCPKRDKKDYFDALNTVLAAGDFPEQRLSNVLAKRRARRYLDNKYWQQDCAFE